MDNSLDLYLDGVPAGTVQQDSNGKVSFSYLEHYQDSDHAYPLSLSMPLARRVHAPKATSAFLWGLLPDREETLLRIARNYGCSPRNAFALLANTGRDAAGAVQIMPRGSAAPDSRPRESNVRRLDPEEFRSILHSLVDNEKDWDPGENTGRWSLAGAQSKVALFRFDDGGWGVPDDSTPTTHIVKPAIDTGRRHAVDEYLSLEAARRLGMAVASAELIIDDYAGPVFVTRRYDRVRSANGRWTRVHQEDLCQALSVHPVKKYQSDGGPGVAEVSGLFKQLPDISDQRSSARRFFDALVFNTAICGTDAHAKNYSLLISPNRITLAPLYDIASMLPYNPTGSPASAMKMGGEYKFSRIGREQLLAAARTLSIPTEEASATIDRIRGGAAAAFADAARDIPEQSLADEAVSMANVIHRNAVERGYLESD